MATQLLEGFESLQNYTDFGVKHTLSETDQVTFDASFVEGRLGSGSAIRVEDTAMTILSPKFANLRTQWTVGLAVKFDRPQEGLSLITLIQNGSGDQLDLRMIQELDINGVPTGSAFLEVRRGASALARSTVLLASGIWHYIEFQATVSDASGSFELRLDGTSILSGSNLNTTEQGSGSVDQIRFRFATDAQVDNFMEIDDIYINDDTGVNDSFLGNVQVEVVAPDEDGFATDFDTSSGSDHYALVDDITNHDADTTYVESTAVLDKEYYLYENLTRLKSGIKAVSHEAIMKLDSGSTGRFLRMNCIAGGIEYPGSVFQVLDTTYHFAKQSWDEDPDTGVAWSVSGVQGSEFGFEVVG